jgi:hypothetical protein
MCDPRRCRELRAPLQVFAGDGDPQLGSTTVEMELWADALKIPAGDVRRPMVEAALQLARMIDAGQGMPAAARQFSHVVMSITEMSDPGDFLDEIRARMHARRVAMLAKAVEDGRYPYPEEDQS